MGSSFDRSPDRFIDQRQATQTSAVASIYEPVAHSRISDTGQILTHQRWEDPSEPRYIGGPHLGRPSESQEWLSRAQGGPLVQYVSLSGSSNAVDSLTKHERDVPLPKPQSTSSSATNPSPSPSVLSTGQLTLDPCTYSCQSCLYH